MKKKKEKEEGEKKKKKEDEQAKKEKEKKNVASPHKPPNSRSPARCNAYWYQTMKDLPDVMFIVDTRKEKIALAEGKKLGIKIIALVDTNSDPDGIDFPIPANDDAMRSIKLFAHRIADVYLEGHEMKKSSQEKEETEVKLSPSKKAETVPAPNDDDKSETVVPA